MFALGVDANKVDALKTDEDEEDDEDDDEEEEGDEEKTRPVKKKVPSHRERRKIECVETMVLGALIGGIKRAERLDRCFVSERRRASVEPAHAHPPVEAVRLFA